MDLVMDGDQVDNMTQSCHLSSLSERSVGGMPVVGPIWRGGIEISGKFSRKLDGLEMFMPKNLQPKVLQLEQSLQKSVCFHMKRRRALWPKHFDDAGAAHSDIELFMFPEVSRSEIDYDDLVEHMIANDLAMTSHVGNFKLIIFTSLEQDNQQHIKGKYYLWGMVKGKEYMRCKSSKGKNTNSEKERISKPMTALECAEESNRPSSGRSAPSVGHQPITTTQSAVIYNFLPSLSQGCKRPRSKRGRISRTLKEIGDVHKSVVADFPGSPLPDLAGQVTINTATKESEQRSWDSNMEIDEPSDSSAINVQETEVEHRSWDSVMEIDEPIDDVVKGSCQLIARVDQLGSQASDPLPEMDSCRTPVLTFEEPGPCSSSSPTLVLEFDEEEGEEETAMKGTGNFNEGSSMITTTSMLNLADHFLETSSHTSRVQVGQYTIKSDLAPILMKILIKYGDIGLGCSTMPESVLEKICKAFQDLEHVSFKELRSLHLDYLRYLCQLGESLKIDMKWLYNRCEDLEKTVLQISQYPFLKEELAQCNKSFKSLEENMDLNRSIVGNLLKENKLIEEEVETLTEQQKKLQCEIEDERLQSRRFIGKSLVDGLF